MDGVATAKSYKAPRAFLDEFIDLFPPGWLASRGKTLIADCYRRIYRIWKLFGFASEKEYSLTRAIRLGNQIYDSYRGKRTVCGWFKTMKFIILNFCRSWMDQPYEEDKNFPSPPCYGLLFPGRGEKFLYSLRRTDFDKFQCLINTMLISVKGCLPRSGPIEGVEARLNWVDDIIFGDCPVRDAPLEMQIKEEVRQLIGSKKCDRDSVFRNIRVPSTSANYINSRCTGGSVVPIGELFGRNGFVNDLGHEFPRSSKPEFEFSDVQKFIVIPETARTRVFKDERGFDKVCYGNIIIPPIEELKDHYSNVLNHCIDAAYTEEPLVQEVALSEALKIRMITKCPPLLMFVMNAFIDPLRKWLRTLPTFELTGTPQESSIMDRMFPDATRKFCSGDYVSSTDKLAGWVSNAIAEVLCETFFSEVCIEEPRFPELLIRSLTQFRYEYCGKKVGMKVGQLMGSVTSFPVLCLANYALCRIAMQLNPPEWTGLLINGDDCVFEASDECYARWRTLGARMGLAPSPGKVWHQVGYIQMNSRSFVPYSPLDYACIPLFYDTWWDTGLSLSPHSFPQHLWKKVPIILCGAAEGMVRSTTLGSEVDLGKIDFQGTQRAFNYELVGLEGEFLQACKDYFRARYTRRVFRALDDFPSSIRGGISYNLPRRLGGLGFDGPISDTDRRVGSSILNSGLEAPKVADDSTWMFRPLVLRELDKISFRIELDEDIKEDYSALYWWVLFKRDVNVIGDLYRDPNVIGGSVPSCLDRFSKRSSFYYRMKNHQVGPLLSVEDLKTVRSFGHHVVLTDSILV
jgi:hypothetical protein